MDKLPQQRERGARTPVHLFFVLYVLAMVLFFLVPVPSVPVLRAAGRFDKVVHLGIFLGFALLYELDRRPSAGRTLLISFTFAAGIELVQWALPYRSADWWDFAAGAAGAGIGVVVSLLLLARVRRAEGPGGHPG